MESIKEIIKRIEKQTRYALPTDECNSAGNDWVEGYEFLRRAVSGELDKIKKEYNL